MKYKSKYDSFAFIEVKNKHFSTIYFFAEKWTQLEKQSISQKLLTIFLSFNFEVLFVFILSSLYLRFILRKFNFKEQTVSHRNVKSASNNTINFFKVSFNSLLISIRNLLPIFHLFGHFVQGSSQQLFLV